MNFCDYCHDDIGRDGVCLAGDKGVQCTRDKGHTGDHVACMQWTHQINIWENETPAPGPDSPLRVFFARAATEWNPAREEQVVARVIVAVSICEATATFAKFLEAIDPGFDVHTITITPESKYEVLLAE